MRQNMKKNRLINNDLKTHQIRSNFVKITQSISNIYTLMRKIQKMTILNYEKYTTHTNYVKKQNI